MNGTEHSDSSAQPLNQESRDKPPIRTKTIGAFTLEEIQEEDSGGWNPKNLVGKVKQEVESLRRTTPYTLKLLAESIAVAPKRTLMVMVGTFARNLVPSVSLKLNSDLIKAASDAAEKKIVNRKALFTTAFCSVGVVFLTQLLESFIKENDDILDRRLTSKLEAEVLRVYLSLDLPTHEDENTRDLLRAANRITTFRPFSILTRLVSLFASIVDLFSQALVVRSLLGKNTRLLVLLCATRPLLEILWTSRSPHYRMRLTSEDAKRMTEMAKTAKNAALRKEVHLLGLGPFVLEEYKRASDRLGDTSLRPTAPDDAHQKNLQLLGKALDSFIYIFFSLRATKTPLLSLATLTLVQSTTSSMVGKVRASFRETKQVSSSFANIQSLYDSMTLEPRIKVLPPYRKYGEEIRRRDLMRRELGEKAGKSGMKIEFRDVTFTYPNAKTPALVSVSFTIEAGSNCALVGVNGAGKSTLVCLIARLYDPDSGQILINDEDIKTWDLQELRKYMSILPQELAKFPFTIKENIALGSRLVAEGHSTKDVSQSSIDSALKAGGALEFVSKLPLKDESRFMAGGRVREFTNVVGRTSNQFGLPQDVNQPVQLSGGQMQRLGIARAFIRANAALHVFDEPDSSLDPAASADLFKRLSALGTGESIEGEEADDDVERRSSTTIYTTHRFSTTRKADQILVIENGRILENGSHSELIVSEAGRYRELYSLQASGFV